MATRRFVPSVVLHKVLARSKKQPVVNVQYGTWALSRLTSANAGRVQPVLDIDFVLKNQRMYEDSIRNRRLHPSTPLSALPGLYAEAIKLRNIRDETQRQREENSTEIKKLMQEKRTDVDTGKIVKALKERGKVLRDELRVAVTNFNKVNDEIIDLVLSLPNLLDEKTPIDDKNEVFKRCPVLENVKPWAASRDLEWTIVPGVGPAAEFPRHKAALLELELAGAAQGYLLANNFVETGNVDFVQSSVFDVTGMDPKQFIRIRESNIHPSPEHHASYLVGGASFPAFLALFAQSLVRNPGEVMPIRYFVIGRSYGRHKTSSTVYQRSAVHVFIACRDELEMEAEVEKLLDLTGSFLSYRLGTSYVAESNCAVELETYERRRVSFRSDEGEKTLSHVSSVGDHVSKRLLCCYADKSSGNAKFMHLVTGRFLNLTDFLRPNKV